VGSAAERGGDKKNERQSEGEPLGVGSVELGGQGEAIRLGGVERAGHGEPLGVGSAERGGQGEAFRLGGVERAGHGEALGVGVAVTPAMKPFTPFKIVGREKRSTAARTSSATAPRVPPGILGSRSAARGASSSMVRRLCSGRSRTRSSSSGLSS
jgi:hypothetical protein